MYKRQFAYFVAEASLLNGFRRHTAVDLRWHPASSLCTPNKLIQLDEKHESAVFVLCFFTASCARLLPGSHVVGNTPDGIERFVAGLGGHDLRLTLVRLFLAVGMPMPCVGVLLCRPLKKQFLPRITAALPFRGQGLVKVLLISMLVTALLLAMLKRQNLLGRTRPSPKKTADESSKTPLSAVLKR